MTTTVARCSKRYNRLDKIENENRLRKKIKKTTIYNKRDVVTFPTVNFPFISSNIPASPAYGAYISQLVCYSRACDRYGDFQHRAQLPIFKLLKQG